jgi:general secretion pathway protein L
MMSLGQASLRELGPLIRRGFDWWLSELRALLPGWARDLLHWAPAQFTVDVLDGELVVRRIDRGATYEILRLRETDSAAARVTAAAQLVGISNPVTIRIPRSSFLIRRVELPNASTADLRKIIDLELDGQSPIGKEETLFDFRIAGRDRGTGKLDVEIYIVERATVAHCVDLCRALGLTPSMIESIDRTTTGSKPRLGLAHKLPWRAQWKRWSLPALMLLVIVLGLANLASIYLRDVRTADRLNAEVQKAKIAADAADRLRADIEAAKTNLGFLADRKQPPLTIQILTQVSRVLPDNTWVFSLRLDGRDIHIRGFSPDASGLIKLIDQSEAFSEVQFQAPVMRGENGLEHFDMSFKLKSVGK